MKKSPPSGGGGGKRGEGEGGGGRGERGALRMINGPVGLLVITELAPE